ncbi:MAG: DUF4838 domain-containing protein [Clostridia bacterium]|nr:DUF4838 domain-containing protein [Clostridia bacterium]
MSYTITVKTLHPAVLYAADELKKYFRMMMPRCGDPVIAYSGSAGFCVGVTGDFADIPADIKNAAAAGKDTDDILYINTSACCGIIAANTPRGVLLAVYQYLREQGCNWLFPGPDGEVIPNRTALADTDYSHTASYRYRGQCNEGSETQPLMMDAIAFTPKTGMNTFMLEFDIPRSYYVKAYRHSYDTSCPAEPLSSETVLQWKRECEAEISRRGLLFHDMGHGWTAEPFGLDSSGQWARSDDSRIPDEARQYLAQLNGVRTFYGGVALNTNICMSNPRAREIMAAYIADYASLQTNVDFLHIWLADASNNHCECEKCAEKVMTDWYVMLLNDIDRHLSERQLATRIVFISYVDTLWPPVEEKLVNPDRFTLLFAPITRLYSETYQTPADRDAVTPYVCNHNRMPQGMAENLGYLQAWQEHWRGDCFCYEYHFWMAHYCDLGGLTLSKLLYDDIRGLRQNGLSGIVEDGSQRAFWPNGFLFYVYARTLYDREISYETLLEEYFTAGYGKDWKKAVEYLKAVSEAADFAFVKGERSADPAKGRHYNPDLLPSLRRLAELAEEFRPVVEAKLEAYRADTSVGRCEYVHWDLLRWHTDWVKLCGALLCCACVGDTEGADAAFAKIPAAMQNLVHLRPDIYDHELCCTAVNQWRR